MLWSEIPKDHNELEQSEPMISDTLIKSTSRTDKIWKRRCLATSMLAGLSVLLNVILLASTALRADTGNMPRGNYRNASLNANLKAASAYSPIFDEVDMQLGLTTMNGALHDNTSIYRMPPSREVDAAWERLDRKGVEIITVSADDITLSGKDPALSVKAPLSWGQGPDAYPAQIDIFHVLHCLNEVRKEMWPEHYYDDPSDSARRNIKAHCLHILLQNLLCTADASIIQYNWMHDSNHPNSKTIPFPDYSLVKKCRNFDVLLEWTIARSVSDFRSKWAELRVPNDAVVLLGDIIL